MSATQRPQKPWSMKWIVFAILVTVVPYTYLRWHFRKPQPAYQPYHDTKDRVNTARLLAAGFQRIILDVERPADPLRTAASAPVTAAPGGLPDALANALVDTPQLPAEILTVSAAPSASPRSSYSIELTCTAPDNHRQIAGAQLYVRQHEMFLVPVLEELDGQLLARNRASLVRLTVPAGALKPGRYHATVLGTRTSKSWPLDVK